MKAFLLALFFFVFLFGCAKELTKNNQTLDNAESCNADNCNVKCDGFDFYYGGYCEDSKCSYKYVQKNSQNCGAPFVEVNKSQVKSKYDFYTKFVFCDYDPAFKKYTLFFEIRNRTENIPKVGSTIWLKVPSLKYDTYKTIFREYKKNRIFWEDHFYTYEGIKYSGQSWEIRNILEPSDLDFELVYCEPTDDEQKTCDREKGILLFEGNTKDFCTN